jgi:hypothetical protein
MSLIYPTSFPWNLFKTIDELKFIKTIYKYDLINSIFNLICTYLSKYYSKFYIHYNNYYKIFH